MEACPVEGAMVVDEKTGARLIEESRCTGCGECAEACPYNKEGTIIVANTKRGVYVKCDLCGGDPQCASFCPTGALKVRSEEAA